MCTRTWMQLLGCVALLVWQVGCGSQDKPVVPNTSDKDANTTAASNIQGASATSANPSSVKTIRFQQPDEAVRQFLTALKAGDQVRATSMLSVKAQQEMSRTDAAIRPPGSASAQFEVTEVELLGDDKSGAHVLSTWNDQESNGDATHEIVWILRKESSGWAIAGMATSVFEDQPPLILNFEDPMEAQRKRSAVDAEIARRQQSPDASGEATKTR